MPMFSCSKIKQLKQHEACALYCFSLVSEVLVFVNSEKCNYDFFVCLVHVQKLTIETELN